MFRQLDGSVSTPLVPVRTGKPRVLFVADQRGWCGDRLSRELISSLKEYDCSLIHIGAGQRVKFEYDLYLYRNIYWMSTCPPPIWAQGRIICMLESERPLYFIEDGVTKPADFMEMFKMCGLVVPMNAHLRDKAIRLGVPRVSSETIANGVNCEEFSPAGSFPGEFTVGASGNFSSEWYDEWKGFSRYIVPACRLAGVRLRWCGWKGSCRAAPGGEQVPLEKMGDWYRGLSCFVSMSQSEGCSGVTFEAMASGLPVISTKVGWHGENCEDILWADRAPDGSPSSVYDAISALARRITLLKNNPSLCRELGVKNRLFALQWPHSRIADAWRPILQSVLLPPRL
jgi:glycosyltransferase involved in cell wall biosynthesis